MQIYKFFFQGINEKCRFDVINLENHDLILGTPFLWQHKVIVGFNLEKVVIGSLDSVGDSPYILIGSASTELKTKNICKKAFNSQKTVSLFVYTGFLVRDSSNLVVQRFLTLSTIYLDFLLFFRSRVPLIFQSSTLLIPNLNSNA